MERTDHDRMGHGHNASFLPTVGGGMAHLGQVGPQGLVLLVRRPRSGFPRAFVIAGCDARPRGH
jgi:hypothetical protein